MNNPFSCARCHEAGEDGFVRSKWDQYEVRKEVRRNDRTASMASVTLLKLCKRHAEQEADEIRLEAGRRVADQPSLLA